MDPWGENSSLESKQRIPTALIYTPASRSLHYSFTRSLNKQLSSDLEKESIFSSVLLFPPTCSAKRDPNRPLATLDHNYKNSRGDFELDPLMVGLSDRSLSSVFAVALLSAILRYMQAFYSGPRQANAMLRPSSSCRGDAFTQQHLSTQQHPHTH